MNEAGKGFCCDAFQGATANLPEGAIPSLSVTDDGVLTMIVAVVRTEEGPAFMDHAVLFCPFCGTKLQDARTIAGKVGH